MKMNPDDLERLVDRSLRELPLRPAPAGLEERVLAEIVRSARRRRLRWAFGLLSIAAAALAVAGATRLVGGAGLLRLGAAASVRWQSLLVWRVFLRDLSSVGASLLRAVPPLYLYGAAVLALFSSVVLAAFGLLAYRSLSSRA